MQADNDTVLALAQEWLSYDPNETTRREVDEKVKANDVATLRSWFTPRIAFGTAGLRARMGAGYACINDLVVIQTAQGLLRYLQRVNNELLMKNGIVVGYDGRYHSKEYAAITAAIFLSENVPVHLYSTLVATPLVAFAVPQLQTAAGIMVTASHNPKQDNGYKVYWSNGAQIIPPHDVEITASILANLKPWREYSLDISNPLLHDPLLDMSQKYFMNAVKQCNYTPGLNPSAKVKVAYTAMHGVGAPWTARALQEFGLPPYIPVKEQILPDPEFPTVAFPNPEEGKGALALAIKTANDHGCSLILANDPDADRLAVAEFPSLDLPGPETDPASWRILNGNEIAFLLADWVWTNFKERLPADGDASKAVMLGSSVSSKAVAALARKEGFVFVETLTGFKWMGNVASQMQSTHHVLFAFEVEIGFLIGDMSFDKDGVRVAAAVTEMTNHWRSKGITLSERLEQLGQKYGYFEMNPGYYFCDSSEKLLRVFNRLRNFPGGTTVNEAVSAAASASAGKPGEVGPAPTYPSQCGEYVITSIRDCTLGIDTAEADGRSKLPLTADAQMITFRFSNGAVCTFRNSGTEPKLKFYFEATGSERAETRRLVDNMTAVVIAELLQPDANGLIPQKKA